MEHKDQKKQEKRNLRKQTIQVTGNINIVIIILRQVNQDNISMEQEQEAIKKEQSANKNSFLLKF